MNLAVVAERLTKHYDGLTAVDHIDLSVSQGEVFGFLGPNGAGKTTTIRMLTGLTRPDDGQATVMGYALLGPDLSKLKKAIGVVPEVSNLYDELTALDNLLFVAQLYGVPRDRRRERAEQLLHQFGLFERRNTRFGGFSRGMKRALTIAAALVHRPQLVFLDEPTSGLDVVAARRLRAAIRQLRDQGVTVFLTTHYLEEADSLCDRLAVVVGGRIVARGSPDELKSLATGDRTIEAHFDGLADGAVTALQSQEGVYSVEAIGDRIRLHGDDVLGLARVVLNYAEASGTTLAGLNTVRPSLEDAFVRLTGLSTEAMLAEKGERRNASG